MKVKIRSEIYPIKDWDNIEDKRVSILYSTPNNDYWVNRGKTWFERPIDKHTFVRPDVIKFNWSRYKEGMKLHGRLVNNVFIDSDYE